MDLHTRDPSRWLRVLGEATGCACEFVLRHQPSDPILLSSPPGVRRLRGNMDATGLVIVAIPVGKSSTGFCASTDSLIGAAKECKTTPRI